MKKVFTFFVAVLLTASVFAQSPQKMSYQAVIRNNSNALVTSTAVGMRISILQGSGTGTEVFKEIYNPNPQTNANGLVTIEIGSGIPLIGTFASINWTNGPYFIKTETDPTGGTIYTITGTSQLLTVPYALHAKTAESISGGITETDPLWSASPSFGIINSNISNWNSAFGWGNHATAGYLTSFTETDPIWTAASSNYYTKTNMQTSGQAQLHFNNLTNKPTTIAGYGITDAFSGSYTTLTNKPVNIDEDATNDVTLSSNQTITGNKTFTGTTTVAAPVNTTDAATKAYVDALKETIYQELLNAGLNGIVNDIDGNSYKTIKIGNQTWMAENLATTKYNDGTPIDLVTDNGIWNTTTSPAYCWPDNNIVNKDTYGALYKWYTINSNLCPIGWRVSNENDWNILRAFLGGSSVAGGKLKQIGIIYWLSPNTNATNSSGFTALPVSTRNIDGTFNTSGTTAIFWNSYNWSTFTAVSYHLSYDSEVCGSLDRNKNSGLSIRCIKN